MIYLQKNKKIMRTKLFYFVLLLTGGLLLSSCDETDDLLKDLAKGKMTVIIDEGTPALLTCEFGRYGSNTTGGEVMISGSLSSANHEEYFSIMQGSYDNGIALEAKSYSTAKEGDMINLHGSYGYADQEYPVIVKFITISSTEIKGTFSGKLKSNGKDGKVVNVTGAFWAVPQVNEQQQ